jgi:hypothetical protein
VTQAQLPFLMTALSAHTAQAQGGACYQLGGALGGKRHGYVAPPIQLDGWSSDRSMSSSPSALHGACHTWPLVRRLHAACTPCGSWAGPPYRTSPLSMFWLLRTCIPCPSRGHTSCSLLGRHVRGWGTGSCTPQGSSQGRTCTVCKHFRTSLQREADGGVGLLGVRSHVHAAFGVPLLAPPSA